MSKRSTILHHPILSAFESLIFWVILLVGSFLITRASLDYFLPNIVHGFLIERPALTTQSWWRGTLYIHVVGGVACLLSSLLQYSKVLLKSTPNLHRYLGRVYAYSVITLVFPSGIILSFTAKGGWLGTVGFLVLSLATLATVLLGVRAIKNKQLKLHQTWITRSFALVTTAITFRILQILFFHAGMQAELNYQFSLWLSILINVCLAEYYLFKQHPK